MNVTCGICGVYFPISHAYQRPYPHNDSLCQSCASKRSSSVIEATSLPEGLTKREYFAAMALSGSCVEGGWEPKAVALFAIACADEMLRQLGE